MNDQTPAQPRAQSTYRVDRSRVDDFYQRSEPLPYVQVGAGEVTAVAGGGETCAVQFEAGVEVGGVVVLGSVPEVGDWVEVHQRGDLLVVPADDGGDATPPLVVVHHGTDPNVPRPDATWVLWLGTVEPNNGLLYDCWEEANI